jgi:hypothetical protein
VAGEDIEIRPTGGHVDRNVGDSLSPVHEEQRTSRMSHIRNLLNWHFGAHYIRDVMDGNDERSPAQLLSQLLPVDFSISGHGNEYQFCICALARLKPGQIVGVVFGYRRNDPLARPQTGPHI